MSERKEDLRSMGHNLRKMEISTGKNFTSYPFDDHEELFDQNSQVRMISDSLTACKEMFKHRHTNASRSSASPLKRYQKAIDISEFQTKTNSETLSQNVYSREQNIQKENENSVIISYMVEDQLQLKYLSKCCSFKCSKDISRRLNFKKSFENTGQVSTHSTSEDSTICLYDAEKIDVEKLLNVIQRDLKTLTEISPGISLIAVQLSDTIFHYQDCRKCRKKFYGYFPQILNRVQNLIKYVTNQQGKNYVWPNDYSYIQLDKTSFNSNVENVAEQTGTKYFAKLERVDAFVLLDDCPGVQIQLSVKIEKSKKKFYETIKFIPFLQERIYSKAYVVLHYNEFLLKTIVNILKQIKKPRIVLKRKYGFTSTKNCASAIFAEIPKRQLNVVLYRVLVPSSFIANIGKAKRLLLFRQSLHIKEIILKYDSNPKTICIKAKVSAVKKNTGAANGPGAITVKEQVWPNVSCLVKDLLREAEEEDKMQVQKVKDLEIEVKGLRDLMLEVHKNQVELSKVLLEKGVYSQPIIKLTDPSMLDEECQAVNKVNLIEIPQSVFSTESLQLRVDKLKKKCTIKNRMIVALLKGLRSNVPKEWWEELVDCIFNESKPIEEFDPEKVNEFIRQTSLYLVNGEKESTATPPSTFCQELSAEGTKYLAGGSSCESDINENSHFKVEVDYEDTDEIIKKQQALILQRERLSYLLDPQRTSSFIQNILYEDSQAGVAVLDLFVAVKRAKDKLNYLAKENDEASNKMKLLKEKTMFMKTEYKEFMENLNDFSDKMNDVSHLARLGTFAYQFQAPNEMYHLGDKIIDNENYCENNINEKNNQNTKQEEKSREQFQSRIYKQTKFVLDESEKELKENNEKILNDVDSQDNNQSVSKRKSELCMLIKTPEEVIASLVATSVQKKLYSDKGLKDNSAINLFPKESAMGFNFSEGNIQVKSDACKILSRVTLDGLKKESFSEYTYPDIQDRAGENVIFWNTVQNGKESGQRNSIERKLSKADMEDNSEGESLFEEALSEPNIDTKVRSSVTCMGDLTKSVNKKSVSTLTVNDEIENSWVGKLTEDIKSKLMNLKPNTSNKQTFQSENEKSSKNFGGVFEFTISANTPVGVFDVIVRQYKQSLSKTDTHRESDEISVEEGSRESPTFITPDDSSCHWSNQSFPNPVSNFLPDAKLTGEESMEEFLEVYVESQNANAQRKKNLITLPKGNILKTIIKQDMAPISIVQKCRPNYFMQELLPKLHKNAAESNADGKNDGIINLSGDLAYGKTIVQRISDDLVIYIQVEVEEEKEEKEVDDDEDEEEDIEEDEANTSSEKMYISQKSTGENISVDSKSEFERKCRGEKLPLYYKKTTKKLQEISKILPETQEETNSMNEEIIFVKEPRKKSVTFQDEFDETVFEEEITAPASEEEKVVPKIKWEMRIPIVFTYNSLKPNIWDIPNHVCHRVEFETREELPLLVDIYTQPGASELKRALELIHEIENNVVGVKLSDAILILPHLESELRKHLQHKIKEMSEKDASVESSLQDFFSSYDILPEKKSEACETDRSSEERLCNLMTLLSNLEEAIRQNEMSTEKMEYLCNQNSSHIYKLLHALTQSIKELESGVNISNLAETLNITSQLDTAVREYDSVFRKQAEEFTNLNEKLGRSSSWKDISTSDRMKSLRKKVFQTVEDEAVKMEDRIDKDFDRIDRLERENDEAMKFVEAFLQKTTHRTTEYDFLKKHLKELTETLDELYDEVVKKIAVIRSLRNAADSIKADDSVKQEQKVTATAQEPPRNTVSGLLEALDTLKARGSDKNAVAQEVRKTPFDTSTVTALLENKMSRSSKSSFTTKSPNELYSVIRNFRKIGDNSLYLAWSNPEGILADFIVGYEIMVNGKVNQKVRNPNRLQAILYSVDLSLKAEVQLYALVENGSRLLLAAVTHYDS